MKPCIRVQTAIFGEVEICGEYQDEAEARAAGYVFDAHAYRVNEFGGKEPVGYKVLVRNVDGRSEFCAARRQRNTGNEG